MYADILDDEFLKFCHRNYLLIVVPPLIITALIDWRITVFLFAIPSVIVIFSGAIVNTVGHLWGYRNFETKDHSRNNTFFNLFFNWGCSMLHNNHHHDPSAYNFKMSDKWYETDFLNVFIIEKFLIDETKK